ncbi:MAG: CDP-glycerol glycerophosphotransferase family protein, partial [Clostridia bacterium]|nr:CDP-glycerol glycerophosphotransferase family protein [Clostridia bacterium]
MKKLTKVIKCIFGYIFLAIPAWIAACFAKIWNKDLWIVYECGQYARDNGYWFFKYLRENHPEQKVVYIINKKSPDYQKVASLGKTCNFRTIQHWFYYFLCSKEISTHPTFKPTYYLNKKLWKNKTYFLQHGVIRDYTGYVAKNINLKLFVTSAYKEYEFIKDKYGFNDNVVHLLGLPRHDNLMFNVINKQQILIMPTWRHYLSSASEQEFKNSEYFKYWNGLLNSKELKLLLTNNDKKVIFYPHREMQKFIHLFNCNDERIQIGSISTCDVQTLLKESAILVTDYSSVFFDFAYMKKPVIWYLFDEDTYHKNHHNTGYFNERDQILGDYTLNEKDLLNKLDYYIKNDFKLTNEQIKNIENFYPFFDG